jgi:hypothetical protein
MENPKKPSEISSSLQLLARIQKPAFLWGAPGVGKSQIVGQVAAALGLRLIGVAARFVQNCTLSRRPGTNNELIGVGVGLFIG